jgi:transmembrane sensor
MKDTFDRENLRQLADKWKRGALSDAEQEQMKEWDDSHLDELLVLPDHSGGPEAVKQKMLNQVLAGMAVDKPKSARLWPRIAVAAAAVVAITLGVWLYFVSYSGGRHSEASRDLLTYANDIAPGKNRATLTLADGKVINLSEVKSGVVINKSGLRYSDQSEIGFSPDGSRAREGLGTSRSASRNDGEAVMLTASTPRGGTYQVVLPDGTKIWLNADSKISFPSQFNGETRTIQLSGEAYMEVAKDKAHPFIVESEGQRVEVLGTHFNINAYVDEGTTKTTLLEGSVKVSSLRGQTEAQLNGLILKPNQQAVLQGADHLKIIPVNIEEAVSWQKGYFRFNDEKLRSIMKKLARWYNIEIVYEGKVSDEGFTGTISRSKNISQVLSMLEKTKGIHFKIEGRRVTVSE